jgi:hypothetical protein
MNHKEQYLEIFCKKLLSIYPAYEDCLNYGGNRLVLVKITIFWHTRLYIFIAMQVFNKYLYLILYTDFNFL